MSRADAGLSTTVSRATAWATAVTEAAADTVVIGGRLVHGWKYPVAVIADALQGEERSCRAPSVMRLRQSLLEAFRLSAFRYFDPPVVPEDLDTAAVLARVFRAVPSVLGLYDATIARNRRQNGLVPTWLDCDDHGRFGAGESPYHLDVLLNFWLTEVSLGRSVDVVAAGRLAADRSLRNYWYLPALYTPFLYCLLVEALGLMSERSLTAPLKRTLCRYRQRPRALVEQSSEVRFPEVQRLIVPAQSASLNELLYIGIYLRLAPAAVLSQRREVYRSALRAWQTLHHKPGALYWTVGFRPYTCLLVSQALGLRAVAPLFREGVGKKETIL